MLPTLSIVSEASTMKSRLLTIDQLRNANVYPAQEDKFLRTFVDSVEVTAELAREYAGEFDWRQAA